MHRTAVVAIVSIGPMFTLLRVALCSQKTTPPFHIPWILISVAKFCVSVYYSATCLSDPLYLVSSCPYFWIYIFVGLRFASEGAQLRVPNFARVRLFQHVHGCSLLSCAFLKLSQPLTGKQALIFVRRLWFVWSHCTLFSYLILLRGLQSKRPADSELKFTRALISNINSP